MISLEGSSEKDILVGKMAQARKETDIVFRKEK